MEDRLLHLLILAALSVSVTSLFVSIGKEAVSICRQ